MQRNQPKEAISIIKIFEELLKGENRKIIITVGKHEELLKKFEVNDEFFRCVGLSRYFKIYCVNFLYWKK